MFGHGVPDRIADDGREYAPDPECPECGSNAVELDDGMFICCDCGHEWECEE